MTIREVLRLVPQGETADTLDIAEAIAAEFRARGDDRAVSELRSSIRQEAAAMGVGVRDR